MLRNLIIVIFKQIGRSKSHLTEKEDETNATDQDGDSEFITRKSMFDMLKVQESMAS